MSHYYRWQNINVLPDDLTAFAWSAPMRELAARMDMSDVGLRKMLRSYGVVLPPQGHWNRVHAGRAVSAPPKAHARRPGETGRTGIDQRFLPFVAEASPIPSSGPFATKWVPEDFDELRTRELKAIGRVPVARTLELYHPGLKGLLTKEESRRTKAANNKWHWDEPQFDSTLWQRQLRLLNALFLAIAKRGCNGDVWHRDREIDAFALIGDTRVDIDIAIVGKHATTLRSGRRIPDPTLPAATPLRLSIKGIESDPFQRDWCDDAEGALEKKVGQIAAELIVAGEATFRRLLAEKEKRTKAERLEREAMAEKERIEQEERRIAHLKELNEQRIANLHRSGELLRLAADVRALVTQVREASLDREEVDQATLAEWEVWALAEADRLDPILSGQFLTHVRPPRSKEGQA